MVLPSTFLSLEIAGEPGVLQITDRRGGNSMMPFSIEWTPGENTFKPALYSCDIMDRAGGENTDLNWFIWKKFPDAGSDRWDHVDADRMPPIFVGTCLMLIPSELL